MPSKPRKACRYPGCPNLTTGRYCEEHKEGRLYPCRVPGCPELTTGRYCDKHQREEYLRQDALRKNATERGYDAKWARVRAQYLKHHPTCEACGNKPARMVHHLVPLREGGSHKWENLQALCRSCHGRLEPRPRG